MEQRGLTHINVTQGAVELLKDDGKHTCAQTDTQMRAASKA